MKNIKKTPKRTAVNNFTAENGGDPSSNLGGGVSLLTFNDDLFDEVKIRRLFN